MLTDGYPLLSAYTAIPSDPLYREMQTYSERFWQENTEALEYYSKRWVANPLHHWSRIWEYLFVTERFGDVVRALEQNRIRTLDAGSGLTFFAHWLAHKYPALAIECCDIDPRSAASATRLRPPAVPTVTYATQDLAALTYAAGSFDVVDCVSVLEHAPRHEEIVAEFARVLRPGGRLILTIDISRDGRSEIPLERARALIGTIGRWFTPERDYSALLGAFDASRMLTTEYARDLDPTLLPWKYPNPREALRNLLRPRQMLKPRFKSLTCFGMVWTRRP